MYQIHVEDGLYVTVTQSPLQPGKVELSFRVGKHELDRVYLTPAQAVELSVSLSLMAEAAAEAVKVMPGFTLDLSRETTQGSAPLISSEELQQLERDAINEWWEGINEDSHEDEE